MSELKLEEKKILSLRILKYIDKCCRDNELKYSLGYGSLLGAIRHKEFIPWDDDIDIIMPFNDYKKLLNILKNDKHFELKAYHIDGWFFPFSKLSDKNTIVQNDEYLKYNTSDKIMWGVSVDIFPMHGIPNSSILFRIHRMLLSFVRSSILKSAEKKTADIYNNSFRSNIYYFFCNFVGCRRWQIILNFLYSLFQNQNRIAYLFSPYKNDTHPSYIFNQLEEISFENQNFYIIKDWDIMLNSLYGDYMTPPPSNKRNSGHFVTVVYKEN